MTDALSTNTMPGNAPFFDRESHLRQLAAVWESPGAQLVTLWGRRRVGKSSLLSRFASGRRSVYLYGTRIGEKDTLVGLSRLVALSLGDVHLRAAPFGTWDSALEYLSLRGSTERLLVVFDEFPYLCESSPGLDTLVQRWWDQYGARSNMMLVLAGSGLSFMEGMTGARGALHGRRTAQVEVHPFGCHDSARFFPELSPTDRVRAYACFGGIPAYLRHWRTGHGLATNVRETFLAPGHFLFREGEELLRTEFHQETLYASILRAVASGQERPSDIARAVSRNSADEIFQHLRRLQELRFIRREVPVTEQDRPRTHRALYRLADPYLRFWYRFVQPLQSYLQLGKSAEVWDGEVAPELDAFVARTAWEDVVMQSLWQRLQAGSLPVRFSSLGRWWDSNDEIDVLGVWDGRITVAGECKWTNAPVGERVFANLQVKTEKISEDKPDLWVLASRSGFEPVLRRRAEEGDLLLIEPPDLFDW